MTPEMWTIVGTGVTLLSISIAGFTLLWRYISAAEKRSEARFTDLRADLLAAEQRNEARASAAEERNEARFAALKADLITAEKRTDERFAQLTDRLHAFETEVRTQMSDLRERMAKLEGLLEGLREAITGRRAA